MSNSEQGDRNRATSKALLYRCLPVGLFVVLALLACVIMVTARSSESGASAERKGSQEDELVFERVTADEAEQEGSQNAQTEAAASTNGEGGDATPSASVVPDDHVVTLARLLREGQVHSIRVIGDSLSAGHDVRNIEETSESGLIVYEDNDGCAYEVPSSDQSWVSFFRPYALNHGVSSFVNAAVGGSRMTRLAENPSAWIREGADVIVVMLGTNDIDYSTIERYRTDAETALSAVAQNCSHMVVVSPPRNAGTLIPNICELDEVDRVLTQLCDEHGWEHVSLYNVINPYSDDVEEDRVHPTPQGAQKLWEAFRQRLELPE